MSHIYWSHWNNGAKTKKLTENVKGNHVSLSSATIPDDLTMSSASVFDTFSSNIEQEKESLVTRSVLSDRFVSFRPLDWDWSDDS